MGEADMERLRATVARLAASSDAPPTLLINELLINLLREVTDENELLRAGLERAHTILDEHFPQAGTPDDELGDRLDMLVVALAREKWTQKAYDLLEWFESDPEHVRLLWEHSPAACQELLARLQVSL